MTVTRQRIGRGTTADDHTGDTARTGALKINQGIDQLYSDTQTSRTFLGNWPAPPIVAQPENDRVALKTTDNVASIVAAAAEGTTFILTPGIYRTSIVPKKGQSFIGLGRLGTITLRGSIVLNGAITGPTSGIYTIASVPVSPWEVNYGTGNESYWASFRHDLFVDGVVYQRVATDAELGAGKYRFVTNTIRMTVNPAGKLLEYGSEDIAIGAPVDNVYIENLVVEHYANPALFGAIAASKTGGGGSSYIASGWTIKNCIARWNHGGGIAVGHNCKVIDCIVSDNGQIGVTGGANEIGCRNVLLLGCEMARNNYAGFNMGWDCGGVKVLHTTNFTIMNCNIFDNKCTGVWFDWENINVSVINNHIYGNYSNGVRIECGLSGRIIGNLCRRNAITEDIVWLWGAQIMLQDTSNVDVMGNMCCVTVGDGIGITFQDRTSVIYGRFLAINNKVLGNRIVYLTGAADFTNSGDIPYSGIATDQTGTLATQFVGANQWDFNTYVAPNDNASYWTFYDQTYSQNFLTGRPHDQNSTYTFPTGSGANRSLLASYEKTTLEDAHQEIDPAYLSY